MLGHEIFDPEIGKRVLVDHAFIVSGGEITKAARNWLGNKLDVAKRSQIMFMDRDDILNLFTVTNLPYLPAPFQMYRPKATTICRSRPLASPRWGHRIADLPSYHRNSTAPSAARSVNASAASECSTIRSASTRKDRFRPWVWPPVPVASLVCSSRRFRDSHSDNCVLRHRHPGLACAVVTMGTPMRARIIVLNVIVSTAAPRGGRLAEQAWRAWRAFSGGGAVALFLPPLVFYAHCPWR
jgi:hypothetical protein